MKSLLFLMIVVLMLSCGTDRGEEVTYNYLVKNESGKSIKIKSFQNYPNNITVINTQNVSIPITGILQLRVKRGPGESYNFTNFFNGDSIVVIFDNLKKIELSTKDLTNTRNPLNVTLYSKPNETFIFNVEDYNSAIPCVGFCE